MTDRDAVSRQRTHLEFDSDAGAGRSAWIALGIAAALLLWMGSGYVLPSGEDEAEPVDVAEAAPVTVAVRESVARDVTLYLSAEGQALPERVTDVPAESSGEIAEVRVRRGQDVEAGALIAVIAAAQRQADLERAQSEEARARRELDNARTLLERGVSTVDRVAQAEASYAAARANLAAAEEQIAALNIVAPFAGRIEELGVEEAEFVQSGATVATVVDNTPLTVSVRVPQQALRSLRTGMEADVFFITGEERVGTIGFVGTNADTQTRTFLVEIDVPNPGGAVPAGVSAEVRIPIGTERAHLLSPAILSLGADGTLGVKMLTEGERVAFRPVEIVRAETAGVWVTGLPESATVITVGQGFVSDGERVTPRPERGVLRATDPDRFAASAGPATPDRTGERVETGDTGDAAATAGGEEPSGPGADADGTDGADGPEATVSDGGDEPAGPDETTATQVQDGGLAEDPAPTADGGSAEPGVLPGGSASPETAEAGPRGVASPDDPTAQAPGSVPPGEDAGGLADTATAASTATIPRPVRIAIAQARLAARDYDVGPVTGTVNPRTRIAVGRYQNDQGLPITGDLDAATLARIESAPASPQEIRILQERLTELGYDAGGVDGLLGPATRGAIRDFQAATGLPATGEISPELGAALVSEMVATERAGQDADDTADAQPGPDAPAAEEAGSQAADGPDP